MTHEDKGNSDFPHFHTQLPSSQLSDRPALSLDEILIRHNLRLFYGDLHNHTGYSDGRLTPADALSQMRARGLDFAAITDHGENLSRPVAADAWTATATAAGEATDETFLAVRGFEWSSDVQGHVCVWSSPRFTNWRLTGDKTMREFYLWLAETSQALTASDSARVLATFNHPLCEKRHFDDFAFEPALDEIFVAAECFNRTRDHGSGFMRLLDAGWHVSALGSSDHHGTDWGSPHLPRTGLLASELTLHAWQTAMLARRTFATRRAGLRLLLLAQRESVPEFDFMGTRCALSGSENLTLEVWCDVAEEESRDATKWRIDIVTNGGTVAVESDCRAHPRGLVLNHKVAGTDDEIERWFVARVMCAEEAIAYSSPVWVCGVRSDKGEA